MAAPDPFHPRSRWRPLLPLSAAAVVGVLVALMGVVDGGGGDDLRVVVLADHFRLQHAAIEYVRDTRTLPAPSFDISEDSPNALSDARLVPVAAHDAWRGPYLSPGLGHPTPSSFWGLAEAGKLGPAEAHAVWGRLHRGYGEIDDATARYVDEVLDDGDAATGTVRVTDTWVWFKLAELTAEN